MLLKQDTDGSICQDHSMAVTSAFTSLSHECQIAYWDVIDASPASTLRSGGDIVASSVRLAIHTALFEPKRRVGLCHGEQDKYCQWLLETMTATDEDTVWDGLEALQVWVCDVAASEVKGTELEAGFARVKMGALLRLTEDGAGITGRRNEVQEVLNGTRELSLL